MQDCQDGESSADQVNEVSSSLQAVSLAEALEKKGRLDFLFFCLIWLCTVPLLYVYLLGRIWKFGKTSWKYLDVFLLLFSFSLLFVLPVGETTEKLEEKAPAKKTPGPDPIIVPIVLKMAEFDHKVHMVFLSLLTSMVFISKMINSFH